MAKENQPEESSIDKVLKGIEQLVQLQMLQMQQGRQADPNQGELLSKLTEALERVSQNQLKGADVIAQSYRQVHRPSNEVVPMRSVFNPRGIQGLNPDPTYQPPILRCPCWVPREEMPNDNMLTREEIELLNILVEIPGSYTIKRIDDTKVKLNVIVDRALDDVTPTRLIIRADTGYNNEYFRLMPALHSQLRQIMSQHSDENIRKRAAAVLTMDEEYALIEAGKLSVAA
jgi:hypothetical protein